MTDLHTRLTAAITARLDVARAATPGPWRNIKGEHGFEGIDGVFAVHHRAGNYGYQPGDADAKHIASWDPTTAIRVLEALREVVERHAPALVDIDPSYCRWCTVGVEEFWLGEEHQYPCADVRSVARALGVEVE